MKKLKVGIIGCGLMGGIHAACFARERSCELVGFTNPTRTKAEALAQKYGGQVYDSVEELVEYSGCDAVSIASPQQVHAAQVIVAARAGKHIFCEKPLGLIPDEMDAMQKEITQRDVTFMTGHQLRFHPVVDWVRKKQPRLGRVFHLELEMAFLTRGHEARCWGDLRSGGFFMELGCHLADLSRFLMGDVRHLQALTLRIDPRRATEDCTHCLLQFASGAIGSILVSANHRTKRQGLLSARMLGEKGRIEFSIYPYARAFNEAKLVLDGGQSVFVPDVREEKMEKDFPTALEKTYPGFFDIYQKEIAAFVRAVRSASTPPITFADGRAAVEMVLAAYASQGLVSDAPNGGVLPYRADKACHPLIAPGKK